MSTLLQKVQSGELTPIIYMPMVDSATCHLNYGTGGNFVQNGTLDTASRGANQDNCKASYFDGTADYLSRTSLTGVADGKVFTISFNYTLKDFGEVIWFGDSFDSYVYLNNAGYIRIFFRYQTSVRIDAKPTSFYIPMNTSYSYQIVVDLTNQSNTKLFINGKNIPLTFTTFVNSNIWFTTNCKIGRDSVTASIGELYFDTKYIDLATSNPFWDADTNRPKPVRQVIRETGVTPLIAMPLDASNPGKNYGTGGDFTANSAPYVGARGGSEFWARSAKFDGTTGYLSRGALTGAVDSKTFSFVLPIYKNTNTTAGLLQGLSPSLYFVSNSANQIQVYARNASNSITLNAITTESIPINTWGLLFVCIDMSNTANRFIYFGNIAQTVTWSTYINDSLGFNNTGYQIGNQTSNYLNGSGHGFYFTTDYIDFSQEVNRLKFVDGLGYPKDLKAQIDAEVIPIPLIYLPFDEPTNLGKNLGTGGNFVVNGTVLPSSDVLG